MPWLSRLLRGDRVYVRTNVDGKPIVGSDGRVDVVYKPGGKVYRAGLRNLDEDPRPELLADQPVKADPVLFADDPSTTTATATTTATTATTTTAAPKNASTRARKSSAASTNAGSATAPAVNAYIVYADGACSGNPGPCGIGVVLLDGGKREEISEYLGTGTNNVAELTAIIRALERAPKDRTVIIHSDSAYALGLLGKAWKAKANQALVEDMRNKARGFRDLRLVKVAGHAGIPENERADALARDAVVRRR